MCPTAESFDLNAFHCPDFINGIKTTKVRVTKPSASFTARISLTGLRPIFATLQDAMNPFHCPDFINGIKTSAGYSLHSCDRFTARIF